MGKTRIIAETGAGQHGVAAATVAARFGLPCVVYMGATDIERQKPNVFRMRLLGAELRPVTSGNGTLKDAMNEALRDWVTNVEIDLLPDRHRRRPAPLSGDGARLPVGDRHARRASRSWRWRAGCPTRSSPASAAAPTPSACSTPSSTTREVAIYGVEAGGHGLDVENGHAASMNGGRPGVLHGNRTYLLQDGDGQILEGHSISAGLDYPGVGPEHSWLRDTGRVTYVPATDQRGARRVPAAARGSRASSRRSSRRMRWPTSSSSRRRWRKDQIIVMNLCGRGDKDVFTVAKHLGMDIG